MSIQSISSVTQLKKPLQISAVKRSLHAGQNPMENIRFGSDGQSPGGGFFSLFKRVLNLIFFRTDRAIEKMEQKDPIAYLNKKLKTMSDTVMLAKEDTARSKVAKHNIEKKLQEKRAAEENAIKEVKDYEEVYNKVFNEHKKLQESNNQLTEKQKKDFEGLKQELDKKLAIFKFARAMRIETESLLKQAEEIFDTCKNKEKQLLTIQEKYESAIEMAKMKTITANDAKKLQQLGIKVNQRTGQIEGMEKIDEVLERIDTDYEVNKELLNQVVGSQEKDPEEQNPYLQEIKDKQRKNDLDEALKEFHSMTQEGVKKEETAKNIGEIADSATKKD